VLSVGRLIPRKGLDRLLQAVALASRQDHEIRLLLAGSGPEEGRLRRLAADLGVDLDLRGFVDQAALPAVYGEADVFAFPTFDDPFGIVVLEAAASGLPLVASERAGATPEFVRNGETGFVVDPDDVSGMADALVELARDPSLRRRMGEAAHHATRERTPQRAAAGYAEAVEAAILRPSRARPLLAPT
jgi:glycosyltransferase involved in cell wall biosynthesis